MLPAIGSGELRTSPWGALSWGNPSQQDKLNRMRISSYPSFFLVCFCPHNDFLQNSINVLWKLSSSRVCGRTEPKRTEGVGKEKEGRRGARLTGSQGEGELVGCARLGFYHFWCIWKFRVILSFLFMMYGRQFCCVEEGLWVVVWMVSLYFILCWKNK